MLLTLLLLAAVVVTRGFLSGGGVSEVRWANGGAGGRRPYRPRWAAKKWWLADMGKGSAGKEEAMAAAAAAAAIEAAAVEDS